MSVTIRVVSTAVSIWSIRVAGEFKVIRVGVDVVVRGIADISIVWVVMVAIIREGSIAEISEVRVRSVVRG